MAELRSKQHADVSLDSCINVKIEKIIQEFPSIECYIKYFNLCIPFIEKLSQRPIPKLYCTNVYGHFYTIQSQFSSNSQNSYKIVAMIPT